MEIVLFLLFAVISAVIAYGWVQQIKKGRMYAEVLGVVFIAVTLYGLFRAWVI